MILRRYVGASLVKGWLLVLVVLATVFGLLFFIDELDRARDSYGALEAGVYVLASLPQQILALAPVIALLGSIVAFAYLDRSNELTIVICGGVSKTQLVAFVAVPTVVFMALVWLAMEYVGPRLQKSAEQYRLDHRYEQSVRLSGGGFWSINNNRYLHIREMHPNRRPAGIDVFEFDQDGRLSQVLIAETARVERDGRWLLQGVSQKQIDSSGNLVARYLEQLEVADMLVPRELPSLSTSISSMSLSTLHHYSRHRSIAGLPGETYRREFWKRLLTPATVFAMVLLAIPIAVSPGGNRSRSIGVRISLGALAGILFFLGAQIVFALGQLFAVSPILVAACPALIIAAVAVFSLRRIRW